MRHNTIKNRPTPRVCEWVESPTHEIASVTQDGYIKHWRNTETGQEFQTTYGLTDTYSIPHEYTRQLLGKVTPAMSRLFFWAGDAKDRWGNKWEMLSEGVNRAVAYDCVPGVHTGFLVHIDFTQYYSSIIERLPGIRYHRFNMDGIGDYKWTLKPDGDLVEDETAEGQQVHAFRDDRIRNNVMAEHFYGRTIKNFPSKIKSHMTNIHIGKLVGGFTREPRGSRMKEQIYGAGETDDKGTKALIVEENVLERLAVDTKKKQFFSHLNLLGFTIMIAARDLMLELKSCLEMHGAAKVLMINTDGMIVNFSSEQSWADFRDGGAGRIWENHPIWAEERGSLHPMVQVGDFIEIKSTTNYIMKKSGFITKRRVMKAELRVDEDTHYSEVTWAEKPIPSGISFQKPVSKAEMLQNVWEGKSTVPLTWYNCLARTGKTTQLTQKATELAKAGKKVLLLSYGLQNKEDFKIKCKEANDGVVHKNIKLDTLVRFSISQRSPESRALRMMSSAKQGMNDETKMYDIIMIDECQDNSNVCLASVSRRAKEAIHIYGDVKQQVYQFSQFGTLTENIETLTPENVNEYFENVTFIQNTETWTVPKNIVRALNEIGFTTGYKTKAKHNVVVSDSIDNTEYVHLTYGNAETSYAKGLKARKVLMNIEGRWQYDDPKLIDVAFASDSNTYGKMKGLERGKVAIRLQARSNGRSREQYNNASYVMLTRALTHIHFVDPDDTILFYDMYNGTQHVTVGQFKALLRRSEARKEVVR